MDGLTYHQILAQQYEENAQIMAPHEDFENQENYTVTEHNALSDVGHALDQRERFQDFAGNRNLAEDIVTSQAFDDKSKLSVRYNKDVRTTVFNIDSRFRAFATSIAIPQIQLSAQEGQIPSIVSVATQGAEHFLFRFNRQVKNAISIKMSSIEFPNTFANFSASRGNSSFGVKESASDYYTKVDIAPQVNGIDAPRYVANPKLLASAVQTALRSCGVVGASGFTCIVNTDGNIQIGNTTPDKSYDFDFVTNVTTPGIFSDVPPNTSSAPSAPQLFDTLGTVLGFPANYSNLSTTASGSANLVTGTYLPDTNTDDYIYIKINDYTTVIPQTVNNTYFPVFAKIPITVSKGLKLYDNDSTNTTRKTFYFLQPSNIQTLDITLLDRAGAVLSNVRDYSITLEIEEVVSQALYEKLREL